MSGFISVDRSIWRHAVFAPAPMTEREAFMWMISRAAWSDTTHLVGANLVEIKRGSFATTLREMQSAFMWGSDKKVRNYVKKLKNHGIIDVQTLGESRSKKTHVTISNYDEYQSSGRTKDAQGTHERRTKDAVKNNITKEQYTHSNECVAELEIPAPAKKRKRPAISLPDDWTPDMDQARELMDEFDLSREDMNFCYQQMKGHANATDRKQVNWNSSFGNWVRKDVREGKIGPKSKQINGRASQSSIWD